MNNTQFYILYLYRGVCVCSDAPGRGPSLVVHTSVPFGLQHLEWDKDDVQPIILQELHKLLPDLPQPISIKCQKWRYSQVRHWPERSFIIINSTQLDVQVCRYNKVTKHFIFILGNKLCENSLSHLQQHHVTTCTWRRSSMKGRVSTLLLLVVPLPQNHLETGGRTTELDSEKGAFDSWPLPSLMQVLTSVPDCPGHMTILNRPLLVCGGDAFSHSNFDGCVESALSVLNVLKASLWHGCRRKWCECCRK